tara:strand:- start:2906 stop:3616 length:711 start_codon:yes stop_codon:yes gene_type:complete
MMIKIKNIIESLLYHFPNLFALIIGKRKYVNFEKQFYLRNIKRGDVVFDIGANIGYYSILFSKLCGKNGFVHCFEPVEDTFAILKKRLKDINNVKINNIGAGYITKQMTISYNPSDSEKSTLLNTSRSTEFHRLVSIQKLDEYGNTENIHKLDFVKCDVEGYEYHALLGMEELLRKFLPKISLEISVSKAERLRIISLLQQIGYIKFHKIEKNFPIYRPIVDDEPTDSYFYLYASS